MIPVRHWPLLAGLLLALYADRAMPAARWVMAVLGMVDAAVSLAAGMQGQALTAAVALLVGVWCSFAVEHGSRELESALREMRDSLTAGDGESQ